MTKITAYETLSEMIDYEKKLLQFDEKKKWNKKLKKYYDEEQFSKKKKYQSRQKLNGKCRQLLGSSRTIYGFNFHFPSDNLVSWNKHLILSFDIWISF